MKQVGLEYFTDIHLTILGLVIFLSYFVFITIKALKFDPQYISHLENIPFNDKD